MEDIVPGLLKKIEADFQKQFNSDKTIAELAKKLEKGTATHSEAYTYASKVGSILSSAYKNNISVDALPEGKMWYNIANRVITSTMMNNYEIISKYVEIVQEQLNKAAGIGIKAIKPVINKDRVTGIVNRISSADSYDDIAWILQDPIQTVARSVVDDSIKANVDFHGKSGLSPKIIRRTSGKCCKWCNEVAGIYYYPDVPKDIYRRHQNCDCVIEYDPGNGKRQNVHTKQWQTPEEHDIINARKNVKKESDKDSRKIEYRMHIGKDGLSYSESKSLTDYMSSDAYVINDKLRRGIKLTDAERQFCIDLDNALKKIPTYKGNLSRSLFFYSEDDARVFIDNLKVNKTISFSEYISTTKGTKLHNPQGQVQIYIQNSKRGHDVSNWNSRENEVLYERNSEFVVINKAEYDGKLYVLLEEV